MSHPLTLLRQERALSLEGLARLTGIAVSTLRGIEKGKLFKTNEQTAAVIAMRLSVSVDHLFSSEELSHLGRPPRTGTPICPTKAKEQLICGECHTAIPLAFSNCPECS